MSKERIHTIQQWLQTEDIDVCILTSKENVFYTTKLYKDPHERLLALCIFPTGEPTLVCPQMEVSESKNSPVEMNVIGYYDTDNAEDLLVQTILKRSSGVRKIAVEKEHLPAGRYEALLHGLTPQAFVSAEETLSTLRLVKDEEEIAILREAAELADLGVEIGVNAIREGNTEQAVVAEIEYELKKKGIMGMSFQTMCLTGANAANPHGVPGKNTFTKGDLVLFDLGVMWKGYASDITRTVAFGDIHEKQENIYNTVLQAQITALEMCRVGKTCQDADQAARSYIEAAGYGDYFPHRLGHGLGLNVHEYPSMTSTNTLPFREGMVCTVEPGIYVPNVAGVRIEDDILITSEGAKTLTTFPKELQIIS
ncbi:M24 family metallopeptidase [Bacillus fonticola]|uniref:M24 family metallopeptidase n=1 Tax=Bacillus fonticola TaxID=2728853 RepID=UPI001472F15F|nr:Xaa-Pro peptidase family protein [Bacillus fonticola]